MRDSRASKLFFFAIAAGVMAAAACDGRYMVGANLAHDLKSGPARSAAPDESAGGAEAMGLPGAGGTQSGQASGDDAQPFTGGAPSEGGDAAAGMSGTATGGRAAGGNASAGHGGVSGSATAAGTSMTGGNADSGGSEAIAKCADRPIPSKTDWIPTASSSSLGDNMVSDSLYNPPAYMIDGLVGDRWSSGKNQDGTEWIQIDFGATVNLTSIVLEQGIYVDEYPRHYDVRLTDRAFDFGADVLASGDGGAALSVTSFDKVVSGRYLLLRQTAVPIERAWWAIAELEVTCVDP